MLSAAQRRALTWLCAAVLALFWLQAGWDMAHPPTYESPWGPVAPDAERPPGPQTVVAPGLGGGTP